MNDTSLNWRVEAACLNAWPAPKQIIADGWFFRCAGGTTRRVNSANPIHAGADVSDALIDRAEAFYAAQGRPTIFRVPEMAPAIDERLAMRGYAVDAPTRTLYGEAGALAIGTAPEVRIETTASRTWLAARNRLNGTSWQAGQAARAIIGAIALPAAYVSPIAGVSRRWPSGWCRTVCWCWNRSSRTAATGGGASERPVSARCSTGDGHRADARRRYR